MKTAKKKIVKHEDSRGVVQICFGFPEIDSHFFSIPFGRQIDGLRIIQSFINSPNTKRTHVSQKRQSYTKAIKEFIDLYSPTRFYCKFNAGQVVFDHSIEIYYES